MKTKLHRSNPSIQPSTSTPTAPPPSPAPATDIELKPALDLLHAYQEHLAIETLDADLHDPKLPPLLDTYATVFQLTTIERINDALNLEGDGPNRVKLLKLMLTALSIRERAAARCARVRSAQEREARRQACTNAAPPQDHQSRPAATADIPELALSGPAKDARVPHNSRDFLSMTAEPLPHHTPVCLNPAALLSCTSGAAAASPCLML